MAPKIIAIIKIERSNAPFHPHRHSESLYFLIVNIAITFIVNKVIKDNLNSLLNAFYVYTFISRENNIFFRVCTATAEALLLLSMRFFFSFLFSCDVILMRV